MNGREKIIEVLFDLEKVGDIFLNLPQIWVVIFVCLILNIYQEWYQLFLGVRVIIIIVQHLSYYSVLTLQALDCLVSPGTLTTVWFNFLLVIIFYVLGVIIKYVRAVSGGFVQLKVYWLIWRGKRGVGCNRTPLIFCLGSLQNRNKIKGAIRIRAKIIPSHLSCTQSPNLILGFFLVFLFDIFR